MKKQKTKRILFSWIGHTDIRCMENNIDNELGPLAQAIEQHSYDYISLLSNYEEKISSKYLEWLIPQAINNVSYHYAKLTSPIDFGDIYKAVTTQIDGTLKEHGNKIKLTFHLSPGTPAMAAVWIILAKTRYAAELIESSKEHGTNIANVPFDISAEFIPDLIKQADDRLTQLSSDNYEINSAFEAIIHRSTVMKRLISKAKQIASRTFPVLIEGESGT